MKRALITLVLATPLAAQTDTIAPRPLFTRNDAALAAVFMGATIAIRPIDKRVAVALQDKRAQENRWLQRASMGFRTIAEPGSVIIGVGMYATGRATHNARLADLGLHGTEALFVGEGFASVLKTIFGRARPFVDTTGPNPDDWQLLRGLGHGDQYRSFPSGHTVAGFAAASAVTIETSIWWPQWKWLIGTAMYGGASLIGVSRMYDNKHWASDVIMGAAIGTFAGNKVVRYHRSHPGNRIDRWLLSFSATPADISHTLRLSVSPLR